MAPVVANNSGYNRENIHRQMNNLALSDSDENIQNINRLNANRNRHQQNPRYRRARIFRRQRHPAFNVGFAANQHQQLLGQLAELIQGVAHLTFASHNNTATVGYAAICIYDSVGRHFPGLMETLNRLAGSIEQLNVTVQRLNGTTEHLAGLLQRAERAEIVNVFNAPVFH